MPRRSLLCCILAAFTFIGFGRAQERDLTPLDVLMLKSVSGVYLSPDGNTTVFLRSEPRGPGDEPGSAYSGLYMLEAGGGERALIAGKRNIGGVSWRPGGTQLSFLDRRAGDEYRQLYALPMNGGEAMRLFLAPQGIDTYAWRPDGKALAFTAEDSEPESRASARKMGFKQTIYDEDWNAVSLYLWVEGRAEPKRLKTPAGSVFALQWSPDGKRLAMVLAPRPVVDDLYMFGRLYLMELETGEVSKLVDNPGKLGSFRWSPDSRRVAYISAADRNDPHAGMLFLVDTETRQTAPLTPDFQGMVHSVDWVGPNRLRSILSRGVESRVADFDLETRSWKDLAGGEMAFEEVDTAGNAISAVVSSPSHPSEIYAYDHGSWVRRTDSNPFLAQVRMTRQEVYRFKANDGTDIEGVLLYPREFREGTRYPLVIVAHGGPESHFNNGWLTTYANWGQLLSRKGYFVWFPNYRSSTGRGVSFAKADQGDPMGREFEDHLDAIRHFAGKGWVDSARVGIGGGSYGGYTAAWAATRQSEHFAAAVSFVPIVHVPTMWYTSDIPWEFFYVHYQERWPHEQKDLLNERSPLTYAPDCRTPLLILGGTSDTRINPAQPFMLYRAVKSATQTPVRYVRYPGEGHGNRINVHRYDFCVRTLRWFDHYLKPGDHRGDAPPPFDLDYSGWK